MGSNNADSPDGTAQLSLLFITKSGFIVYTTIASVVTMRCRNNPSWAAKKGFVLKSCRQKFNTAVLPACHYGNKRNSTVTVIVVSCRYDVLPYGVAAGTALICTTLVPVQKVSKSLVPILRVNVSTMLKKTRREGPASCSFAQLHNKRRCLK